MGLEIEKTKRMRLDEDDKGEEDRMNDKEGPHDDDILPLDIPKNTQKNNNKNSKHKNKNKTN